MTQSSRPPIIGITTYGRQESGQFCLMGTHVEAVRIAGGVPILLPPGEENLSTVLNLVEGLIFSGGGDIDPVTYGGLPHSTVYLVDQERDAFDLALAQLALQREIPVLGICRGLEVLIVASGGSLITHVPDEFGLDIAHRADLRQPIEHSVQIKSSSRLAKILRTTEATVVSWHHQAVRTVAPEWQIAAYAPDGVIEALEHKHHPWAIALQWHPELSLNHPPQQQIFQSLIQAARTRQTAASLTS